MSFIYLSAILSLTSLSKGLLAKNRGTCREIARKTKAIDNHGDNGFTMEHVPLVRYPGDAFLNRISDLRFFAHSSHQTEIIMT